MRNSQQPGYLLDSIVSIVSHQPPRLPCSKLLVVPNRVTTDTASHAFRLANKLSDIFKVADSFNAFRRRLKFHLFDTAGFLNNHLFIRHICLAASQAANYSAFNQKQFVL